MKLFSSSPLSLTGVCVSLLSFISFSPQSHNQVNANSLGLGIPCDVDLPTLGNVNRARPENNAMGMPVRAMWWTLPPVRSATTYTLKTTDSATAAGPTSYVPGQWLELYLRTNVQDQQFTGLLMYAVKGDAKDSTVKIGEWQMPPRLPYQQDPVSTCITHSNADPKPYLSKFRVRFPATTGTVRIRALVKFGLAFPAMLGAFYYPNTQDLVLTEGPTSVPTWFQGALGQSCNTVCAAQGKSCDLATMKSAMTTPLTFYEEARKTTKCTLPLLRGCGAATPSSGRDGCYYHDDTCTRAPLTPVWVRQDPCATSQIPVCGTQANGVTQGGECCSYMNYKWCASYYSNGAPNDNTNQWTRVTKCGTTPTVNPPAPIVRTATTITCESSMTSDQDGQRICACATGGTVKTDPPATTNTVVTNAPPAGTTAPPVATQKPDPCLSVNCGDKGKCSFGQCQCTDGFTGTRCQTAPPVPCNGAACTSLNKAVCTTQANVCGDCLPGFDKSGLNNCVVKCDTNACASLNRNTCTAANVCGACLSGFSASSDDKKTACFKPTSPPPSTSPPSSGSTNPPVVTNPPTTTAQWTFQVTAQWQSGFCGTMVVNYDGIMSKDFKFDVPGEFSLTASWNINADWMPGQGWAAGSLPDYITTQNRAFNGGLCMSFSDPTTLVIATAAGFESRTRTAAAMAKLVDIKQFLVSYSIVLKSMSKSQIDGSATFAKDWVIEISRLLLFDPQQINILSYTDSTTAGQSIVSFTVSCTAATQISSASNFQTSLLGLQSEMDRQAAYPYLTKTDAQSVLIAYPTQSVNADDLNATEVPKPKTTTAPSDSDKSAESSSSTNIGLIVGIVVGVLVLLIIVAVVFKLQQNSSSKDKSTNSNMEANTRV